MADLAFGHILWKDLISFVLATGRCVSKEQIFLNEKWSYLGGCAVQPNWFQSKFCGRVQTPKTPTITNYRGGVGLRVWEQNLSVFSFESFPGPKVNLSKHNTLIVHCWTGLVPCTMSWTTISGTNNWLVNYICVVFVNVILARRVARRAWQGVGIPKDHPAGDAACSNRGTALFLRKRYFYQNSYFISDLFSNFHPAPTQM